jgi:hypothetical protein
MSLGQLAAAAEEREASPIALVLILLLGLALVLLIRSMNRHLRKVPPSFPDTRPGPAGSTDLDSGDPARKTDTDGNDGEAAGPPARSG